MCRSPFTRRMPAASSRTEETGIGSLVRDPANGREAQVDTSGRVVALLKMNAVAEDQLTRAQKDALVVSARRRHN
jgi:hypothetical protein